MFKTETSACKTFLSVSAILAATAGFTGFALAADTTDPATKEFENAVALYQKGSYKDALEGFEKLTASSQKGEVARYYKALCLQQQCQYKAAKQEYNQLYYNAKDKNVRYKAWLALKSLNAASGKATTAAKTTTSRSGTTGSSSTVAKNGPGADAWITPKEGYGRSGPEATSSVTVTIIPTSCGRRRR